MRFACVCNEHAEAPSAPQFFYMVFRRRVFREEDDENSLVLRLATACLAVVVSLDDSERQSPTNALFLWRFSRDYIRQGSLATTLEAPATTRTHWLALPCLLYGSKLLLLSPFW